MTPADLEPGMVVIWQGASYIVTDVRSVRESVHGRLYFISLEADDRRVEVTCAERYRFQL